jgi:hypothetical protein
MEGVFNREGRYGGKGKRGEAGELEQKVTKVTKQGEGTGIWFKNWVKAKR